MDRTNLASLTEDAISVTQPVSREPLHPRVHESVRVHHEGIEVDQGTTVFAPLPPAVVTVSREVYHLRLPRVRIVGDRLKNEKTKKRKKHQKKKTNMKSRIKHQKTAKKKKLSIFS